MPTTEHAIRIGWKGVESVPKVARQLARRNEITLHLAPHFHHLLCRRLITQPRSHERLDVRGDAAILRELADIAGLHDFLDLVAAASLADVEVRIESPKPRVHVAFLASERIQKTPGSIAHFRRFRTSQRVGERRRNMRQQKKLLFTPRLKKALAWHNSERSIDDVGMKRFKTVRSAQDDA